MLISVLTSSGSSVATSGNMVREDYKLFFDDKYSLPADGTNPAEQFTGPSRWRIEDAPAEQWISVSTAIRYVTQMRDATSDPSIKQNAEKTLATLAGIR